MPATLPAMVSVRLRAVRAFFLDNLIAAAVVIAGAVLSRLLGFPDQQVSVLWPPTAFMLAWIIRRGWSHSIGGAAGIAAWSWYAYPEQFWPCVLITAAVVLPPWLASRLYRTLRRLQPTITPTRDAINLMIAAVLLQAPLATLFGLASVWSNPIVQVSPLAFSFWTLLVEVTSALVFTPALMIWLKPDKPGARSSTPPSARRIDWNSLAVVALIGVLCMVMHLFSLDAPARWLIVLAFFGPLFSALRSGERSSSLVLALAAVVILSVRTRLYPYGHEAIENGLVPAWLMLSFGAVFVHLLNASTLERWRQSRRLQDMAMQSEIAGLPNVRALTSLLQRLTGKRVKRPIRIVELALPDIASFGERAGRTAMLDLERQAADRLRTCLGNRAPMIAHLSTGRFAMVLPASVSNEMLTEIIMKGVEQPPITIGSRRVQLRASMGLVDIAPGLRADPEAVLAAMSIAQQQAAQQPGRLQTLSLKADVLREHWEQFDRVEVVKQALAEKRLHLLAQLIVPSSAKPFDGIHYEILTRLLDAQGRELQPIEYLPAIVRAGLTREFDFLVIRQTLADLAQRPSLLAITRCCSINVTGPTICDTTLVPFLKLELARTRVKPQLIAIELTESESIGDLDSALRNIEALRSLGVTIALDDFGTGLATFDYVKRFRPDWLKIDGSFIRAFDNSALDREIIQSIVRLAAVSGAVTVAEWVETDQRATQMRGLGIDYLQGFGIAHPVPLAQLAARPARQGAAPTPSAALAGASPAPTSGTAIVAAGRAGR